MQLEGIRYALEGAIRTDFTGFRQLLKLYNELKDTYDCEVFLDFSQLDWFDANLAAVLSAFLYKLKQENRLTFSVDHDSIAECFEGVLHRNGCFQPNGKRIEDDRQSVIACTNFCSNQPHEYKRYVENDLFEHRGLADLRRLNKNIGTRIQTDLLEIFNNFCTHSQSTAPFFVCGQYFPQRSRVVFTMTDLGVGFLPPIQAFSDGTITTSLDAILWALKGNSTQQYEDEPSGCGLSGILSFCHKHKGDLQVVTGESFWSTDLSKTIFEGHRAFASPFTGTTINITFNGVDK